MLMESVLVAAQSSNGQTICVAGRRLAIEHSETGERAVVASCRGDISLTVGDGVCQVGND